MPLTALAISVAWPSAPGLAVTENFSTTNLRDDALTIAQHIQPRLCGFKFWCTTLAAP